MPLIVHWHQGIEDDYDVHHQVDNFAGIDKEEGDLLMDDTSAHTWNTFILPHQWSN